MATIWRVYEGKIPTIGEPWAELPLAEAISVFELRPKDLVSELASPPRFGSPDRDLTFAGFKHVVVEVGPSEGKLAKWKPGFYRSRVRPKPAFDRLVQRVLVAELGSNNVVRVEHEPTTDSLGRDAVRITVVISPGATNRLKNGLTVKALIRLRERLHAMGDNRTPIVEYATEEELAQDVGD